MTTPYDLSVGLSCKCRAFSGHGIPALIIKPNLMQLPHRNKVFLRPMKILLSDFIYLSSFLEAQAEESFPYPRFRRHPPIIFGLLDRDLLIHINITSLILPSCLIGHALWLFYQAMLSLLVLRGFVIQHDRLAAFPVVMAPWLS